MEKTRVVLDFTGKKALVTGGNSGIGRAIAGAFARAGAAVCIVGRRPAQNSAALRLFRRFNPGCRAISFDLADAESIPEFYRAVSRAMGGFDILVNAAGAHCRGRADRVPVEDFRRCMDVNVAAAFALARCFAAERIARRKPGVLIMLASLMSEAARPGTSAYAASKGAIRQLVKALAVDWAAFGIRVNGIGPGYIRTPMTSALAADRRFDAWVRKRTPLGRWGEPSDVAGTALFLASDLARFITGQIIYVDGGWLAAF